MNLHTRGLGGTLAVPVTSCGEENLFAIDDDPHYRDESILVHELGHTVMEVGLSATERRAIVRAAPFPLLLAPSSVISHRRASPPGVFQVEAHRAALGRRLYSRESYMGSCAEEYWAEGTQSWFDATARYDVNETLNTRARLRRHDPQLAALLRAAYGDGAWRFTQTLGGEAKARWLRVQAITTLCAAALERHPHGRAARLLRDGVAFGGAYAVAAAAEAAAGGASAPSPAPEN